jgi:glycosyltransferase involved in cell wall biosynthesis
MIYDKDDLIMQVRESINETPALKNKVHLVGKVLHDQMEMYYNSADYFVSGSYAEGSGYALSEALSCGCVPVVTDIPSFHMMTDHGRLGALWQPGNKNSFIEAVEKAIQKPLENEAKACINFFNSRLSFDAIATKAIQYYQQALAKREKDKRPHLSNA